MTLHLAGRTFGKLRVTGRVKRIWKGGRSRRFWFCHCTCGQKLWVETANLRTGNSTGCRFCWRIKHGHATSGKQSRTYKSWAGMLSRCSDKNVASYYLYGGRGVRVCRRWQKFARFLSDMGERPPGKTLERRNVNGNYTLQNCYWATAQEQGRNRRSTKLSFAKAARIRKMFTCGRTKAEIARHFAVSFSTVCRVVDNSRWNQK